ncbi:hypothetical protein [Gloeocapsa sp. PCC 73106]|uniref:hypothetical protein n=1 Tax=Gloeocapsa sp. PCC 73106 TaxID=102232 RepID=UPI0002ABD98C|nr:hypothetical protein [Gloeocapsa sp. PCC 73106]ELR97831.1 hypothetical protein GLO73106DRAFT_00016480 [Gloeocapsa sp. PCC 73106]
MLTQYHLPVSLCFLSTDLPILTTLDTAATLYRNHKDHYHLVLKADISPEASDQLLWLELSPYRVVMTVQGHNQLSYRHFWERGIYGTSRYWVNDNSFTLRNYTRSLNLEKSPLPENLKINYELWSGKICLGNYVLQLEIQY